MDHTLLTDAPDHSVFYVCVFFTTNICITEIKVYVGHGLLGQKMTSLRYFKTSVTTVEPSYND